MPAEQGDRDRHVVPRWLPTDEGRRSQSTRASSRVAQRRIDQAPQAELEIGQALENWEANPNDLRASQDLLDRAISLGLFQHAVPEAAKVVLASANASVLAREIAANVLNLQGSHASLPASEWHTDLRQRIRRFRHLTQLDPRDAYSWLDLALAYSAIGLPQAADRPIRAALYLAPDDRLVIRSATRYFIHTGDLDVAVAIARRPEHLIFDPWLMAAEISTSTLAGLRPTTAKAAKRSLRREEWPVTESTELSSAVATLELTAGADSRARKMFSLSLRSPTENALAQAGWASEYLASLSEEVDTSHIEEASEARAIRLRQRRQWAAALDSIDEWWRIESFSTRPPAAASYIAATALGDYKAAIEFAKRGLEANPGDPVLTNNLAYAAALDGQIEVAESALSTSSSRGHEDFRGALLATRGLVSYRRGHLQEGNQYYVQAIETFRGLGDSQRASRAALNLSYEQARSGQIPPSEALRLVLELQGQPHLPEEHELIKRAIEDLRNMTDP